MVQRITTEDFVKKAKSVHGDKYDYSLAEYTGCQKHLKIICTKHGIFSQSPNNHLEGKGCHSCGKISRAVSRTKTIQDFIKEAQLVHGNKYDYHMADYIGCYKKLVIICPIHGAFEQSANNHLRGRGCYECGRISTNTKRIKGTDKFIEDAQKVHGGKYDYSQTEYVDARQKVKIVCSYHGIFLQSPTKHLCGDGCPECGVNSSIKSRTKTTSDFIAEAKSVYGDKYDYSQVIYTRNKAKVKIICPEHGEFYQSPIKHLRENACPMCAPSGFDYDAPAIIYLLKFEKPFVSFWKVGITNKNIRARFGGDADFISTHHQWELPKGIDAYRIEQKTLAKFKKYQFDRLFLFKLLQFGGDTECFAPNAPHSQMFDFINSLASRCKPIC